jgi:hypothetical protein
MASLPALAALVGRVLRNAGACGSPGADASGRSTRPSTDFGHTHILPAPAGFCLPITAFHPDHLTAMGLSTRLKVGNLILLMTFRIPP